MTDYARPEPGTVVYYELSTDRNGRYFADNVSESWDLSTSMAAAADGTEWVRGCVRANVRAC